MSLQPECRFNKSTERIAVFRGIDSRAVGFVYITKSPVRGFVPFVFSSTNSETRLSAATLPFYLSCGSTRVTCPVYFPARIVCAISVTAPVINVSLPVELIQNVSTSVLDSLSLRHNITSMAFQDSWGGSGHRNLA